MHVIFAELAEAPWQRTWKAQVLGFMHRLDSMDDGSLHPDILGAATELLEFRSSLLVWACHLWFWVAVFTMLITLLFGRLCWPGTCLFGRGCTFGLVVLSLGVPSFAPNCGDLHCRGQKKLNTEPYHELPLPVTKLRPDSAARSIVHFWVGSHFLQLLAD